MKQKITQETEEDKKKNLESKGIKNDEKKSDKKMFGSARKRDGKSSQSDEGVAVSSEDEYVPEEGELSEGEINSDQEQSQYLLSCQINRTLQV